MEASLKSLSGSGAWLKIAAFALFALSPAIAMRLEPNRYEGGRSRDERATEARNASSVAVILGEVRANVSDMMFIKTERYLDSGVAFKGQHVDMDKLAQTGETNPEKMDKHEVGTVIREKADDFRAFIGDLERKVKPWVPASQHPAHTDGAELLPWYRLMTLSDPHNTRAYRIGAWWLKNKGEAQAREALKFVEEGIANNPKSFDLQYIKGQILNRSLGDEKGAVEALRKAAELAIAQRPEEGPREDSFIWNDYTEEDALAAVRMAVLMERKTGNDPGALALGEKALAVFKRDKVIERQITAIKEGKPFVAADEAELVGPTREEEHDHAHDHQHEHGDEHKHEHAKKDEHDHEHKREREHDHDHDHDHEHDHEHETPHAP